nr:MAG TPA: hypothetical protein [Caudoviricetes sp.]
MAKRVYLSPSDQRRNTYAVGCISTAQYHKEAKNDG